MNKQEILNKIKELEDQLKELDKPKSVWDINEDNFKEYWLITSYGCVDYRDDYGCLVNDREDGNAFLTQEEAGKELEKRKAIARIMKWKHDKGYFFEPDWEDWRQNKYSIYYDYNNNKLDWGDNSNMKEYSPIGYFTNEGAEKCIEECEEDLKIIFEI